MTLSDAISLGLFMLMISGGAMLISICFFFGALRDDDDE